MGPKKISARRRRRNPSKKARNAATRKVLARLRPQVSTPCFAMAYDVLSSAVFGESARALARLQAGDEDPILAALALTQHSPELLGAET